MTATASSANPGATHPGQLAAVPRAVWIALGTLALATAGMAGALVARSTAPAPVGTPAALAQPANAGSTSATPLASTLAPIDPAPGASPAPANASVAAAPIQPRTVTHPVARPAPVRVAQAAPAPATPVQTAPMPVRTEPVAPVTTAPAAAPVWNNAPAEPVRAAVCYSCGTVEAVQAIQAPGQGTGLGAIAGGVLGGVLGNQVGGGSGKKAMTVLGALGGAYGGHVVEQRMRGSTVYDVTVRMEDGTHRTLRQAQALPVGTHVTVDGGTVRAAGNGSGGAQGVPVLRTSY